MEANSARVLLYVVGYRPRWAEVNQAICRWGLAALGAFASMTMIKWARVDPKI